MVDLLAKTKRYFLTRPAVLSWLIVIVVCIAYFSSYIFFIRPNLQEIGIQAGSAQVDLANHIGSSIQFFIDENLDALDGLSGSLSVVNNDVSKRALLGNFLKKRNEVMEISLTDKSGQEIMKVSQSFLGASEELSNINDGVNFPKLVAGKIYISAIDITDKTAPSVSAVLPVVSADGEITGMVLEKFSLNQMRDIVLNAQHDQSGQAYFADYDGRIVMHNDESFLGKDVMEWKWVGEVIKNKKSFYGPADQVDYIDDKGVAMRVVGVPLAKVNWGVFIEVPNNEIWSSYDKLNSIGLVIMTVMLLLFLFLILNGRILSRTFAEIDDSRRRLKAEFDSQAKKMKEVSKMTKLLVSRDLELNLANNKLDKKVSELQESKDVLMETLEEVKEARGEAEEEKEKTMALISSFSTPVIFLDNKNNLTLFNPSAQEVLGINDEDLGKNVSPEDDYSLNNFIDIIHNKFGVEKIKDEQDSAHMEEATFKFDDNVRVYKVVTVKVEEKDSDILGTMKIFYDTTREKTIDKLKSEFISVAAHQLRTPLSAIKWVIRMILDGDAGKLNEEQQELLNKGYTSNERIINLVNDLLNVSRIEEGKFGFKFGKTDFQEVLSISIDNVEALIKKNHQELIVKKPDNLPKVCLDKERMIMVLQNLLGNAIKYTPEYGKVNINIEFDKQYLHVKIKDQGVGIPKEDQPKIFTKFFRAANAVKLETEGTGLGLFMVKNIIEKHNGCISLTSEEGNGTEVAFSIPLENN